jgi:peptidoglycan hydrolase CwlO-like protein
MLALPTSQAFCQNATQKVSKDSLVYLPKNLVGSMINDLDALDTMKVSYAVLEKNFNDCLKSNNQLYEQVMSLQGKLNVMRKSVDDLNTDIEGKDSRIQELTKQVRIYKRQRNWSILGGLAAVFGVHFNWKYGK